jgi:outer membrane protein TolC
MQGEPEKMDEQRLLRLYEELTGSNEASARGVYMYVCGDEDDPEPANDAMDDDTMQPSATDKPAGKRQARSLKDSILLAVCLGLSTAWSAAGAEAGKAAAPPVIYLPTNQPLALAEAINLALRQNPAILRAEQDLEAAKGVSVQTRAVVLPTVRATGRYSAVASSDVDSPASTPIPFRFGNDQTWATDIRLVQSLYEGGRMLSGLREAKLIREQALLNYQAVVADTVLAVQIAYDDVLLAAQQITVQEASVELLTRELTDTTRRFEAGTVPRFNVLRAEVELANARPKLIRARNAYRIAKNNLTNVLGYTLPPDTREEIPLVLSGKLEKEPFAIQLSRAITLGLEQRPELGALRKTEALRREDIVQAKAGNKPSLEAFGGYEGRNSIFFSDLDRVVHGWVTGVQVSWDLFDGFRTQGKIREAKAHYEAAQVELGDAGRRIELEVRTAFSNFIEADEVLTSQEKVVEEAEEAVRLAAARADAGTGTQLDVLSATTALTEARTTQIQALHDYAVARARLERAMGANVAKP